MLNFDEMSTWVEGLQAALQGELPNDIATILARAKPKYVEDAREIILRIGNQRTIFEKIAGWLEAQPFVGFHGSRLVHEEIRSILRDGLRPLIARDRAIRLTNVLSAHSRWHEVETHLANALRDHRRHGDREGQVHLTLSRQALIKDFNHYLVEGSEFDMHIAHRLLGAEGVELLRQHGHPVIFELQVPAGQAFEAYNPYFRDIESATPIPEILAAWGYKMAHSDFTLDHYRVDAGMVFRHPVPAKWIKAVYHPNDNELRQYYRL